MVKPLGMPDTAVLNIINLNIDSIQVEIAKQRTGNPGYCWGLYKTWTHGKATKQDANGQNDQSISNNSNNLVNYFFSSSNITANKKQSIEMTQKIHDRFSNIFNGIGCFEGMFSLQLKPYSKPYQASLRHVAYALQKPFMGGMDLECIISTVFQQSKISHKSWSMHEILWWY